VARTPAREVFAANVRRLRADARWTQEELAEAVGVDLRYLQRLESGAIDAKLSLLDRFAASLKVDLRELLVPAKLVARRRGRPAKARGASAPSRSAK
jgi:transcriptional regulator with XRE-family HTH domain